MKKVFSAILIIMSALFLIDLVVNVFLVDYAASVLLPRTAKQYGIDRASIDTLKPGLLETVAGQVRLGDRKTEFLEIASIKACYTPSGLLGRHVDSVIINGLVVNAAWRDNTLTLPGFSPPAGVDEEKDDISDWSWPVTIGAVIVNNAMINVSLGDDLFSLPASLKIEPVDGNMYLIDGTLRLSPRGQKMTAGFRLDMTGRQIFTRLEATQVKLDSLADWSTRLGGPGVHGLAALSAKADLALTPLELLSTTFDLSLIKGRIVFQDIALGPVDEQAPMTISVAGSTEKGWQVTGSAMAVSGPVPLRFSGFDGFLSAATTTGARQGGFSVVLDRSVETSASGSGLMAPMIVDGLIDMEKTDKSWRICQGRKKSTRPVPQLKPRRQRNKGFLV